MKAGEWFYLEISWSADDGLEVYVDLKKVSGESHVTKKPVDELIITESRLCVGCLNAPINSSQSFQRIAANVIVDELQFCYGSCAKLTQFEFLQRGIIELNDLRLTELIA